MYARSGFRSGGTSQCTLVLIFVPGEYPPKPPFWKPPFYLPVKTRHRQVTELDVKGLGFSGPGLPSARQVLCGDAPRHFSIILVCILAVSWGGQSSAMRSGLPGPKNPKSSAMKTTTRHCSRREFTIEASEDVGRLDLQMLGEWMVVGEPQPLQRIAPCFQNNPRDPPVLKTLCRAPLHPKELQVEHEIVVINFHQA